MTTNPVSTSNTLFGSFNKTGYDSKAGFVPVTTHIIGTVGQQEFTTNPESASNTLFGSFNETGYDSKAGFVPVTTHKIGTIGQQELTTNPVSTSNILFGSFDKTGYDSKAGLLIKLNMIKKLELLIKKDTFIKLSLKNN